MSCPNFEFMKFDMPMICGKTYSQMAEEYEREFGEKMPDSEYYIKETEDFCRAELLAEEFSRNLIFHNITVISGHYVGFQFYVDEKYSAEFDLDKESKYCIDNDNAHYYFSMCKSIVLKKATAEKRKIEKWLYSLKKGGFNVVSCTGMFSNGEATYSIL